MALSLNRISFKTPPPRVVLLPDELFFVRAIPIAENATEADVAAQVELALESMAPFTLAQMYYAHHWKRGARSAIVYASYRKRFSADQAEAWEDAEVVLPVFATLFNTRVEPSTTILITTEQSITGLHWGEGPEIPSQIVTRAWSLDTGEIERSAVREQILKSLGGTRNIIELTAAPEAQRDGSAAALQFTAGEIKSAFTREELDGLDIRDKAELGALRRGRARDLFLWRGFVTCVAGIALAALLEIGLIAGHVWQRSNQRLVDKQAPVVAEIMRAQSLATRIAELSTKRLRPFEMIAFVQEKKPATVLFDRTTTTGLLTLEIEATTTNPGDVGVFQNALRQMPQLADVSIQNQVTRPEGSTFRMIVTFKSEANLGGQS
ncbi:MAG TPA: hypothetical protein VFT72_13525 [Opitutaceae bacterium]|nr:hypothetical protein [Opitutaceae bacterium]